MESLPSQCTRGSSSDLGHAMKCQKGGFVNSIKRVGGEGRKRGNEAKGREGKRESGKGRRGKSREVFIFVTVRYEM